MTVHPRRRVAQVLNSTAVGGAEMVVLRLAGRLQELGWRPEVVTLRGEGSLSEAFARAGISVTDLAVPPGGGVWAMRRAVRRWLHADAPDVIHTHNVSPLVAVALALPRRNRPRFVHTKHGRARSDSWHGRLLTRWAAQRPDAIAAVSRDALERAVTLEGFPVDRTSLIYNGIETGTGGVREPRPGARLVTVARLEPVKAIDVMVRAIAALRRDGITPSLTVVGDGSERPALERLVAHLDLGTSVRFAGWSADVQPHLREADAYIMSSRSEGLSLTLLEAMAAGLPIVATAVGGNPEVVEADVTGLLVPRDDPEALAAAIRTVLQDPGRAAAMGRAGRDRVVARFSLDGMASAYAQLYGAA